MLQSKANEQPMITRDIFFKTQSKQMNDSPGGTADAG